MPTPATYVWRWTAAKPRPELGVDRDLLRFAAVAVASAGYLLALGGG
jgi:hypothetical protein